MTVRIDSCSASICVIMQVRHYPRKVIKVLRLTLGSGIKLAEADYVTFVLGVP